MLKLFVGVVSLENKESVNVCYVVEDVSCLEFILKEVFGVVVKLEEKNGVLVYEDSEGENNEVVIFKDVSNVNGVFGFNVWSLEVKEVLEMGLELEEMDVGSILESYEEMDMDVSNLENVKVYVDYKRDVFKVVN